MTDMTIEMTMMMTTSSAQDASAQAALPAHPLPPRHHMMGTDSWDVTRERIDAAWSPLVDDKGRAVHGYAIISETPAHMLGRTLTSQGSTWQIGDLAFDVALIATRDGAGFGAIPRSTMHATRELAHAHAVRALELQGKRYARKFPPR